MNSEMKKILKGKGFKDLSIKKGKITNIKKQSNKEGKQWQQK